MTLFLVRHGRPLIQPGVPASHWELDPAAYDDVWALRSRLPQQAAWFTSPEAKAIQTAQLLTDAQVGVLDGLCEHERGATWVEDFPAAVRRAFAEPDVPAVEGWEPLSTCRDRVLAAVRPVLAAHRGDDVVLVGHGTAWTALLAGLRGAAPDLARWESLTMPDVIEVDLHPAGRRNRHGLSGHFGR